MAGKSDLADGYYTVPEGKLVNAVTWLEMRTPPPVPAAPLDLVPAVGSDIEAVDALFKTIGTPWLWSRAFKASPAGAALDPGAALSDIHVALDAGQRVGLVDFEGRGTPQTEITWFGLLPERTGRGLGRRMMAAALRLAWQTGPERVWLHTCHFDHPSAIRFYQACGFVPYAVGFEIMDDPRLKGLLPRSAAPHVPLIGG